MPTFFVDRRSAWRGADIRVDAGPGLYWTEFNPTVFAFDEPNSWGTWSLNDGSIPEEGDEMGRISLMRLSPLVLDSISGDFFGGPETRRAIWIESFFKSQDIRSEVNLAAYANTDGWHSYLYLWGGHDASRRALADLITQDAYVTADTFTARSPAGNNRFAVTNTEAQVFGALPLILPQYVEMTEIAAPANAPTDGARLFVEDNGAGKSRLVAIFSSGAKQTIVTEP